MLYKVPDIKKFTFGEAKLPRLRVIVHSSKSIELRLRGFTRYGLFYQDYRTKAGRTVESFSVRLPDLPLSLRIHTPDVPVRHGQCYIYVDLLLGGSLVQTLTAGYIESSRPIAWPPGSWESEVGGKGYLRVIYGTDPAAGNEICETVPTNARWQILGVKCWLLTSADIADRQVRLILDDGEKAIFESLTAPVQTASQIRTYMFCAGMDSETSFDAKDQIRIGLPRRPILYEGYRIRTGTINLQSADDWGLPILWVEEWIQE